MDQQPTRIAIPDDLEFSDLRLARDPATGDVAFDLAPIERICEASGLNVALFRDGPEDNVAGLITAWYDAHREAGGAPDPVAENLIRETVLESQHGHGYSDKPGRA